MANEKKKIADDPLAQVATFTPTTSGESTSLETALAAPLRITNEPLSPLGPPQSQATTSNAAAELLVQNANQRIQVLQAALDSERERRRALEKRSYQLEATVQQTEQLQAELAQEREARLGLERELSAMEVEVKALHRLQTAVAEARAERLTLERQLATLEVRAEKAQQWANELNEERITRIELERQKATLDVEMKHAQKLETMLAEERRARMNAQSRAATAEAQLAKLQGELSSGSSGTSVDQTLIGRFRSRPR